MPVKENYIVRNMTLDEVKNVAVEWATEEGWNPGLHDADVFYNTDSEGFFIGLLNNEPISCISAVSYGKDFGFIGFYIVKPEYRKEGYSIKLCSKAIKHLATQNIGLDGVVEQQENYKKIGFKIAYRNIRYEGITKLNRTKHKEIKKISEIDFSLIQEYDLNLFPAERSDFLKEWLSMPESNSLAVISGNKVTGYGMIRKCRKGFKIGPLFADTEGIAGKLLESLISMVEPGEQYYLDILK